MRILLAATIVGYNLEVIRSLRAKKTSQSTAAPPKRTRKKRRKGTWTQILGSPDRSATDPSGSGRAPPSTDPPPSCITRSLIKDVICTGR
jgi:hypothetical protein